METAMDHLIAALMPGAELDPLPDEDQDRHVYSSNFNSVYDPWRPLDRWWWAEHPPLPVTFDILENELERALIPLEELPEYYSEEAPPRLPVRYSPRPDNGTINAGANRAEVLVEGVPEPEPEPDGWIEDVGTAYRMAQLEELARKIAKAKAEAPPPRKYTRPRSIALLEKYGYTGADVNDWIMELHLLPARPRGRAPFKLVVDFLRVKTGIPVMEL